MTTNSARAAALVTWAYAAAFGASALRVAASVQDSGRLPSFFGMFDMFDGPWFEHLPRRRFHQLLLVFPAVTAVASASGLELWRGRRRGGVLNLALLPLEAVFWTGFALPIPVAVGSARLALVMMAWKELTPTPGSASRVP